MSKLIGAIVGDIIGSPYEFDHSPKIKNFPLFNRYSKFTDDSVMTLAIAEALINSTNKSDNEVKYNLINSMQNWGHLYPYAGYGTMFKKWLNTSNPQPYGSYGNGSAMRVSSVGWLYDTLEETQHIAKLTAEISHNHIEGIKGAVAVASIIFLARNNINKDMIKNYIIKKFNYNLSRTCDEIRPIYHHVESCQETVPEAIIAFLEGNDFEDVIRNAVSLGGDCDTLTCIAGSMAEAFYKIPDSIQEKCFLYLDSHMINTLINFNNYIKEKENE